MPQLKEISVAAHFIKENLLLGYDSLFEFNEGPYPLSVYRHKTDWEILADDWRIVENDLRIAFNKLLGYEKQKPITITKWIDPDWDNTPSREGFSRRAFQQHSRIPAPTITFSNDDKHWAYSRARGTS